MKTRTYLPNELNVRVSGRTVERDNVLYLCHSAAYVEFELEGSYLAAELASEGGAADFQAWIAVYVNDMEVPYKKFSLEAGKKEYVLWENDTEEKVLVRVVKSSENQYAYAAICNFILNEDAEVTKTEAKEKHIHFIGDSITCGFGNEGGADQPFLTETENPLRAYAALTAKKLDAEFTLTSWSGIGIISSYVDPDVEVPNTGVLVPKIYPYTDYSLFARMGWEMETYDCTKSNFDMIVINLCTNDSSYTRDHEDRKQAFKEEYANFLKYLQTCYPGTPIVCCAGAMNRMLMSEVCEATKMATKPESPVYYYQFSEGKPEDGEGSVGHPSLIRHDIMSTELSNWIREQNLLQDSIENYVSGESSMKKTKKWMKVIAMALAAVTCASTLTACGDNSEKAGDTDLVLRFVAMSDVHIGYLGDRNYKRFEKAMESAYEYADSQAYDKIDALLVAGDMTNYGQEAELTAFKSALDKSLREETESLLITGNHEFFKEEGQPVIERWERILEREKNTHNVINGYHFINLSLSGYKDATYTESLDWFEAELAKAAKDDPEKPIFVQHHYAIKGTVYGSNLWGTSKMTTIMRKYPQIISFSGHSHYPMNDPRSIWQGDYTALGCGTLAYYELEPGMMYGTIPPNSENAAQYYIVEVHKDNSVTIKGYDIITDQFFDFEYTIEDPSDKSSFQYTNDRKKTADTPVFAEGAKVTVESVEDTKVTLTIPQATDGECIHSYRFDFYINGEKQSSASIWSEFYFLDMPETLTQEFTGLVAGSNYTVEVTAIDSWGKESETTIKAEFSTLAE